MSPGPKMIVGGLPRVGVKTEASVKNFAIGIAAKSPSERPTILPTFI